MAAEQRAGRHVLAHDREHRIEIAAFGQRVFGFDREASGAGDGDDGLETPDVRAAEHAVETLVAQQVDQARAPATVRRC